jgi:hypothetical protein
MITSINQFKLLQEKKRKDKEIIDGVTIFNKETLEPIDPEEYEIGKIIDIITDVDEITKIEEQTSAGLPTGMTPKSYKNGDIIWLTVMLEPRNKSAAYNIGEMGIVKCKIMQSFRGLSKLNQLQRKGLLHT